MKAQELGRGQAHPHRSALHAYLGGRQHSTRRSGRARTSPSSARLINYVINSKRWNEDPFFKRIRRWQLHQRGDADQPDEFRKQTPKTSMRPASSPGWKADTKTYDTRRLWALSNPKAGTTPPGNHPERENDDDSSRVQRSVSASYSKPGAAAPIRRCRIRTASSRYCKEHYKRVTRPRLVEQRLRHARSDDLPAGRRDDFELESGAGQDDLGDLPTRSPGPSTPPACR